jgi:hypothetical protein
MLLEPSGSVKACNGIALPLPLNKIDRSKRPAERKQSYTEASGEPQSR